MNKRYNKKILTMTHRIESNIQLEERIKKIAKIIVESQRGSSSADCPDKPINTIGDLFSDTLDSFNPHGASAEASGGVEQSIVDWGKRVEDKIACLSHNDAIRLFGAGYVATYVTDFYDHILKRMGLQNDEWRGILKIALLSITLEEIPDIVGHWNKSSTTPAGDLSGTIPGTINHPANPDGGWYGCEKVAWAILTGALNQYGIVKVKSINTIRNAAQGSKIASTIVGLFATERVVQALEIGTTIGVIMEYEEVKQALEEITIEVCSIDNMASIMGIGGTLSNIGARLMDQIGEPDEDAGELEAGSFDDDPVPGSSGSTTTPDTSCPEGQHKNSAGVCVATVDPFFESRKLSLNELREKLNIRGGKGYGTGHAFIDRKPPNLGLSVVQNFLNKNQEKNTIKKDEKKKVKVSKAFTGKNNDNI